MNTNIMERTTVQQAIATARVVYMPRGRDALPCEQYLEAAGVKVPPLSSDAPQAENENSVRFIRVRTADGLTRVQNGAAGAVAFAGTDVCLQEIAMNPNSTLAFKEFGEPMGNYELLLPKNMKPSLIARLKGEGAPLRALTSTPRMLALCAFKLGWNVVPADFVPTGGVEVLAQEMISEGEVDLAADLVTSGGSAEAADFWTSRSKNPPADYIDPVLRAIRTAVVWRKPGVEYIPPKDLVTGLKEMDATLLDRIARRGDPTLTRSNTVELLASPQKAFAKILEEAYELAKAILECEGNVAVQGEFADVLRASVLFMNALLIESGQPPITFETVLKVLIGRNENNPRTIRQ